MGLHLFATARMGRVEDQVGMYYVTFGEFTLPGHLASSFFLLSSRTFGGGFRAGGVSSNLAYAHVRQRDIDRQALPYAELIGTGGKLEKQTTRYS